MFASGNATSRVIYKSPGGFPGMPFSFNLNFLPLLELAGIFTSTKSIGVGILMVAPRAASHGVTGIV